MKISLDTRSEMVDYFGLDWIDLVPFGRFINREGVSVGTQGQFPGENRRTGKSQDSHRPPEDPG